MGSSDAEAAKRNIFRENMFAIRPNRNVKSTQKILSQNENNFSLPVLPDKCTPQLYRNSLLLQTQPSAPQELQLENPNWKYKATYVEDYSRKKLHINQCQKIQESPVIRVNLSQSIFIQNYLF